jgi:hypothetical protein
MSYAATRPAERRMIELSNSLAPFTFALERRIVRIRRAPAGEWARGN